jgi:hypothetical protein
MEMIDAPVELFRQVAAWEMPSALANRLQELRDAWGRGELTPEDELYFEGLAAQDARMAHLRDEARRLLVEATGGFDVGVDSIPGDSSVSQPSDHT